MERYIDADALEKDLISRGLYLAIVKRAIEDAPTEDVAPIADTVRKMQERLHEIFSDRAAYTASHCHEEIDRIAEEMLEGEK